MDNNKIEKSIVSPTEFNDLIDELTSTNQSHRVTNYGTYVELRTINHRYIVNLIGDETKMPIDNANIAKKFYKETKLHQIENGYGHKVCKDSTGHRKHTWDLDVASGYQYSDEDYANQWLNCWSYDINSAYAFAMMKKMPNTNVEPRRNGIVGKNEMGFYSVNGGATTDEGDFAEYIFPLIDSPFKSYVYEKYKNKKEAKDPFERKDWKNALNIPSGLLATKNIFLRNAMIYYSNEYIKSFIDENTVYCNVDCIVSLMPRYDLPIGNELGQFKVEHECDPFYYIKTCEYQWKKKDNTNDCHYSGIPSYCLSDIADITDWQKNLKYEFKEGKIYERQK